LQWVSCLIFYLAAEIKLLGMDRYADKKQHQYVASGLQVDILIRKITKKD
jgi:hypothetical protein